MRWENTKPTESEPMPVNPKFGVDLSDPNLLACNCGKGSVLGYKDAIAQAAGDARQMPVVDQTTGVPMVTPVTDYMVPNRQASHGNRKIVVFDVDLSMSMEEYGMPGASSETKIQVLKNAMPAAINQIPLGTEVEIRVFGPENLNPDSAEYCKQSAVVFPLQKLTEHGREEVKDIAQSWRVGGLTPTTYSLRQIANIDLAGVGKDADVTIKIMTDGAETLDCDKPLCDYYRDEFHVQYPTRKLELTGLNLTEQEALDMLGCLRDQGVKTNQAYDEESLIDGFLGRGKVKAQLFINGRPAKNSYQQEDF